MKLIFICAAAFVLLAAAISSARPAIAQSAAPPAQAPESQQGTSDLVIAAKLIVSELVQGDFDKVEAQYSSSMAAAMPKGALASGWSQLVAQVGSFQSVAQARSDQAGDQMIVTVTCKFERMEMDGRIAFDAQGKLVGINFRPHPQPVAPWVAPSYAVPTSFTESPLELVNGKYDLPGTLTVPKGDGPFPVVVLVHGSGPHDQDETIGPNKPFKDLAWGLASHGIAVYRYTKRTAKYGTQISDDPASLTVDDEVIRDAQAAVALVAKQPRINPRLVFLLGHSLGAYLAPRIANGDSEIAGLILLSAPSEPIEQLALLQTKYIATLGGIPTQQAQQQIKLVQDSVSQIESPELKSGDTVTFIGASSPASYWLDLRGYHPEAVAATLPIPMLILQGERDYQVPMSDFNVWKTALQNKRNATLESIAGLNHMFVEGSGASSPQEYSKPAHVDERVITAIINWVPTAAGKSSATPASF